MAKKRKIGGEGAKGIVIACSTSCPFTGPLMQGLRRSGKGNKGGCGIKG